MQIRQLIVPAVVVAFSLLVIWASLQLEESPAMIVGDSMQPRTFPIFLMCINLVLVVWLIVQTVHRPVDSSPDNPPSERFPTWATIGLLPLFYLLTAQLDLFLGIAVVMFAMCWVWGERRWWVAAITATATPACIFFLFDLVLKVRFPRGLLTNLYYG
ncbi:MAG: tripartite tricarboxylate transporter TctB family protein [Gammaproteobacteria bacterium]|nr:tripartite tricarboxylate transporter TctB family protein [Gammaproteobacteria bacterium]